MQKEVDDVHDFYPIVKTCEICKFCRYSQRSEPDLHSFAARLPVSRAPSRGQVAQKLQGWSAICPGLIHLFSLSFAHTGVLWVCEQNLTRPLAKHLANVKKMLYIAITLKK